MNMSRESSLLTFDIICMILFGEDIHEKLEKCTYINPQGETHQLEMHDALEKISIECSFAGTTPMNIIFPKLVEYDIGRSNRINTKNSDDVSRVIQQFLENGTDMNSVYHKVLSEGQTTKAEVYADIMSFMFGGHETTSRALTTALFELKKKPEMLTKLREEINTVLFKDEDQTWESMKDKIDAPMMDSCEYLTLFVKEVLRYMPPASRSLGYKSMK
jgi:cytochrome P450